MSIPGAASPLFLSAAAAPAGAYQIDRCIRLNSGDSAYLNRTPSSAGNRKTWTYSTWIKRSNLTAGDYVHIFGHYVSDYTLLVFKTGDDRLQFWTNSGAAPVLETSAVLRDPSAWYHIVLAVDTTQSTASDRAHIYINGVEAAYDVDQRSSQLTQNLDTFINSTNVHEIGGNPSFTTTRYFNGYLAENYLIDGQQLAPTDLGEYDDNNNWNPKAYSGSYGTNGFHLDFSDNSSASALGTDAAGSNDWTVNNISVASGSGNDSLIDTPTNYTADSGNNGGNYCVLNPLDDRDGATYANGNLQVNGAGGGYHYVGRASFGVSSGKFYWEVTINSSINSTYYPSPGICSMDENVPNQLGDGAGGHAYMANGQKYTSSTLSSYGASFTQSDIIGFALDMDAGTLTAYKNGTSQGTMVTGLTGTWSPSWSHYQSTSLIYNFGQRPFAYTPPTGYLSLCTENLPDPTIADGSTAMDTSIWSGNSTQDRKISTAFSPDLVWVKRRNASKSHIWIDKIRGDDNYLHSDTTNANQVQANLLGLVSDGYELGTVESVNLTGNTYVGWAWDGGSSTSSNSDGSITSNVRANASAGFSIVSYTGNGTAGATVGHGLNDQLGLLVVKNRSNSTTIAWGVKHSALYSNAGNWLRLDSPQAATVESAGAGSLFNATNPTSSVFTLGPRDTTNTSGDNYIAYCWAPVSGFSAFGSYVGSQNFPFVYCGFRPRYLLIKPTNLASGWQVYDSERSQFNVADKYLAPHAADAEVTSTNNNQFDFLSNGFVPRGVADSGSNYTGYNFLYCAFAEHPFKTSRAK